MEWGLIWDVVPRGELHDTAFNMAKSLASQATRGFGLTKRALNRSFTHDFNAQLEVEAEAMQEAGRTNDYAEGVRAFREKRPPKFKGS